MEMTVPVRPLTSFLIEDILSTEDGTSFNSKRCSQKRERCTQWEEGAEKLSEQRCRQETAFGVQTGEILQLFLQQRNVPIGNTYGDYRSQEGCGNVSKCKKGKYKEK